MLPDTLNLTLTLDERTILSMALDLYLNADMDPTNEKECQIDRLARQLKARVEKQDKPGRVLCSAPKCEIWILDGDDKCVLHRLRDLKKESLEKRLDTLEKIVSKLCQKIDQKI